MGKITRKRHTREFKTSIIRELESGKNLAQISRENNLPSNHDIQMEIGIYRKNPESAFRVNGNIYKEAAKNQELERLIGKLYSENEFLKKALGILEKRGQEEKERPKDEVKFMIISDSLDSVSVNRAAELLEVSSSGFYKWFLRSIRPLFDEKSICAGIY